MYLFGFFELLFDCFFFFFFQAEDGIRDLTVTGVQTCALPISTPASRSSTRTTWPSSSSAAARPPLLDTGRRARQHDGMKRMSLRKFGRVVADVRSEERRVGKECRSWWSS